MAMISDSDMFYDDDHEFDAAAQRAYYAATDRHRFAQAQEDRDTGMELDPLLFEPRDEEETP
jgi:hypothetical protein